MSKSRLEWKVGLFVAFGLLLLGALLLQFSKGLTFFQPTYVLYLSCPNIGGLKPRASVLMSGVRVGTVSDIRLLPQGNRVELTLRIFSQYQIRTNATFVLDQSGFLGDQYVAIGPGAGDARLFVNGERAEAPAPFNLQEFTRTATGFISRINETLGKLDDALASVTRMFLNPETMTNLAATVQNLRAFSEDALNTADKLNALVTTNTPALSLSSSNLAAFSGRLSQLADRLDDLVATNSPEVRVVLQNLETSSATLKTLLEGIQAGEGLAGNLLKNPELSADVSRIANNLSTTTSNLNRLGLWGILWKQKTPRTNAPPGERLEAPKHPFN